MNHTITLTTTEALLVIGALEVMRSEASYEAVERLLSNFRVRVYSDLKMAENEKWKSMDDDL